MKRSQALKLNEIIEKMLADTGLQAGFERRTIESLWPQVVGPHIASYTRRVMLDGRRLHVYIDSAPLKEELGYMRDSLVEHLNAAAGHKAIDAVIIH